MQQNVLGPIDKMSTKWGWTIHIGNFRRKKYKEEQEKKEKKTKKDDK